MVLACCCLPGCGGGRLAVWFTGIEHGGRARLASRRGSPLVGVELWGLAAACLLSAVRLLPFWGLLLAGTKRRAAPLGCCLSAARRWVCDGPAVLLSGSHLSPLGSSKRIIIEIHVNSFWRLRPFLFRALKRERNFL